MKEIDCSMDFGFVLEFATIVAIIKFGTYVFIGLSALLSGVFLHETGCGEKSRGGGVCAVFAFTSYKSVSHCPPAQENL
jgi:hypothetical protein